MSYSASGPNLPLGSVPKLISARFLIYIENRTYLKPPNPKPGEPVEAEHYLALSDAPMLDFVIRFRLRRSGELVGSKRFCEAVRRRVVGDISNPYLRRDSNTTVSVPM